MAHIRHMRGGTPSARRAADVINLIIDVINHGTLKPGSILYLGNDQRQAIRNIEHGDPLEPINDHEFAGWPVIWVRQDSYTRLI